MERITLVYGETGSGKSTAAKALLRERAHIFAIDPMGEYGGADWSVCETRRGVLNAVTDRIRKGKRLKISYRCGGAYATEAPWLARAIYCFQMANKGTVGVSPHVTLVMEEANAYYPAQAIQSGPAQIFDELVLRGRHYGVNILAVTQRPSLISTTLRGNAGEIWAFHMPMDRDRKAVDEKAEGASAKIKTLPDFHCLRVRRRSLETWRTLKSGGLKPVNKK